MQSFALKCKLLLVFCVVLSLANPTNDPCTDDHSLVLQFPLYSKSILCESAEGRVQISEVMTRCDESTGEKLCPPIDHAMIKIWYNDDTIPSELGINSTELCRDPLSYFLLVNVLRKITDVDVPATIVHFITNTNENYFQGPVGLTYFLNGLIPQFPQCINTDANLCCFNAQFEKFKHASLCCFMLGVIILLWLLKPRKDTE